jgi:hypothetical protein
MSGDVPGRPARAVKPGERWTFTEHKTCAEWGAPRRVLVAAPPLAVYRIKAIAHAADLGDAPWAPDPDAGAQNAALCWLPVAHCVAVYVDHGIDPAMATLLDAARGLGIDWVYRVIECERWAHALLAELRPEQHGTAARPEQDGLGARPPGAAWVGGRHAAPGETK